MIIEIIPNASTVRTGITGLRGELGERRVVGEREISREAREFGEQKKKRKNAIFEWHDRIW